MTMMRPGGGDKEQESGWRKLRTKGSVCIRVVHIKDMVANWVLNFQLVSQISDQVEQLSTYACPSFKLICSTKRLLAAF